MNRISRVIALTLLASFRLMVTANAQGTELQYPSYADTRPPATGMDGFLRRLQSSYYAPYLPSGRDFNANPSFISAIWDTAKAPFKYVGAPVTAVCSSIGTGFSGDNTQHARTIQGEQADAIFQARFAMPTFFSQKGPGMFSQLAQSNPDFYAEHGFTPGWGNYPGSNGLTPKLVLCIFPCAIILCILVKRIRKALGMKITLLLCLVGGVYAAVAFFLTA
jgi:hypothetical protein